MDPKILYLDLPLLRTFITLIDQQGYSLAANELGRTQSAISQQIKKLEELAGQKLGKKQGRHLYMTEAGKMVYRHGMRMLQVEQQLREELFSEEIEGRVRLGIPEDLATHYLLPILARFREQYPRIQLSVECDLTENLYQNFKANEYELVILKHEQLNVAYPDRIVKTWYDPLVWVGRDLKECNEWQDSRQIPVIVSPEPCVYRRQVLHQLNAEQFSIELAYVSESYNSKLLAIRAGMGLAALPQSLVPPDFAIVETGLPALSATQISLFRSDIQAKVAQYLRDRISESFDDQLGAAIA